MAAGDKLAAKLRPVVDSQLRPGEEFRGVIAATSAKIYGSKTYVVVVTDRRLAIQPTTPTWRPDGDAISLRPDEIAEYTYRGMAERTLRGPLRRLSSAGFVLRMKTVDERPYELMGWTGDGPLGGLGGGKPQSEGMAAVRAWLEALDLVDTTD